MEGHDPSHMIASLDAFSRSIEGGGCASVACIVVDREQGELTYCRAGHPPPLLVRPDGAVWLDARGGPVLGIDATTEWTNTTVPFGVGDMLVMYTDGLVERRRRPIEDQLGVLTGIVGRLRTRTVTEVANAILVDLVGDNVEDDIVLVVKRLEATD